MVFFERNEGQFSAVKVLLTAEVCDEIMYVSVILKNQERS